MAVTWKCHIVLILLRLSSYKVSWFHCEDQLSFPVLVFSSTNIFTRGGLPNNFLLLLIYLVSMNSSYIPVPKEN